VIRAYAKQKARETLRRVLIAGDSKHRFYSRTNYTALSDRVWQLLECYFPACYEKIDFPKRARPRRFVDLDHLRQAREIRELLSLLAAPKARCADVKRRADIKLRDIEEKIRALQAMRRALRRLVSQCDGKLPASECPILESLNVGAQLYTWCAWDTLFLPELLEKSARVESVCDATGKPVRLSVSPKRVESADPGSVCISLSHAGQLALPTRHLQNFCHYIHFFRSRKDAEVWTAKTPGTFILSLDEATELARRKNQLQFGALLSGNADRERHERKNPAEIR
jgi:hypothetical protein